MFRTSAGYILEAEPSQRYIIPAATAQLAAEPNLNASTKRLEAAAAASAATAAPAPEVRMERPEAREAPKQGSGPPPKEKSPLNPVLLGLGRFEGDIDRFFGLLRFHVFTSM